MNISSLHSSLSPMQPFGPSLMGGQNSMATMLQTLMQLMMQLGSMQNAGSGMLPGMNPGFGGAGCGCGGGSFGSPSPMPGGGSFPGFGSFGGNGSAPNPGSFNSRDSYVPPGNSQAGAVGDLGTGQGSDAVRWALSHEGVSESNNPGTVRAFSRGRWQPWCADFVSQAYANSPGGSPFGHQSSVAGILSWGRQNNKFFNAGTAASNPGMLRPGDIAVWKSNGRSHVGLVTGVNRDGTFNTIEGNSGDAVRRRTHSFGRGLTGFVRPRDGGTSGRQSGTSSSRQTTRSSSGRRS